MSAAHWVYLACVVIIMGLLIARKSIVIPAIAATFVTVLVYTGSFFSGLSSIFTGTLTAGVALFEVFIVVAFVRALYEALRDANALNSMVAPFVSLMRTRATTFWALATAVGLFSLLFWATATAALVGAVLVPVALRIGLSTKTIGAVMLVAGGIGTSDYILHALPGFTSSAAGVPAPAIAERAMVIVLLIAIPGLVLLQIFERRRHKQESREVLVSEAGGLVPALRDIGQVSAEAQHTVEAEYPVEGRGGVGYRTDPLAPGVASGADEQPAVGSAGVPTKRRSRGLGLLALTAFTGLALYMVLPRFTDSISISASGTALVTGLALVLLVIVTAVDSSRNILERCATQFSDGLTFSFKAMGPVLPIAGFFLLGNGDYSANITGVEAAPGFFLDALEQASGFIPQNAFFAGFAVVAIGLLAGLDGSAIANIPMVASLAAGLAEVTGADPVTMAALAQVSAVWSGGGMLVPWSSYVLVVAAILGENPVTLVRRVLLPTALAFIFGTTMAILLF
jgi:TRAP-type C4-dicarboxylate transport system permease large subunit